MDTSSNVLDVELQSNRLSFKASKNKSTVFDVRLKEGPLGNIPTVMTGFCSLPVNGKKTDDIRGIATYQTRHNKKFSTLKLELTDETAGDVIKLCKNTLSAWREAYNPLRRSSWYQTTFSLGDGTKVHHATRGIDDPELFADYVFHVPTNYESPSSTFFKAMYGDEVNAPWYYTFSIPTAKEGSMNEDRINSAVLVFRSEDGKSIKAKVGTDCPAIPTTGVPLTDTDTIRQILQSSWYRDSRWKCKTSVQLTALEWKVDTDIVTSERVLYPIFHLKTAGSILLKRTIYELPEGVVPYESRALILNDALFDGVEAPAVKKRKRTTEKSKAKDNSSTGSAKKTVYPEFEKETLSDTDIEGDAVQKDN